MALLVKVRVSDIGGGDKIINLGHIMLAELTNDAGAFRKIFGVPIQGINQSKVVQHPRPQSYGHASDFIDSFINEVAHSQEQTRPAILSFVIVSQTHQTQAVRICPSSSCASGNGSPLFFLTGHDAPTEVAIVPGPFSTQ
jgi:hypothetical protein